MFVGLGHTSTLLLEAVLVVSQELKAMQYRPLAGTD